MQKIEQQGKTIAYNRSGAQGEFSESIPVVLLHGFCEDARMWEEWLNLLPDRYRYLCIDLPGFGNSDVQPKVTMSSMADAVAAVLEAEGIERCVLVGHSMGGYVSLAFAEKYAEKLRGLCLFHSQPYADTEEKMQARLKSVEFIERNGHILYVRQLIPKLFAYDYSKGYPAEVNRMIFYASKYEPGGIIAALHAMRQRPDRSQVLENLDCPVQFFVGEKDTAVPHQNSLAQTYLPDMADIHLYPTVGHMGMFEAARETAKSFRAFLTLIENRKG